MHRFYKAHPVIRMRKLVMKGEESGHRPGKKRIIWSHFSLCSSVSQQL
jgi:hypothetical protein